MPPLPSKGFAPSFLQQFIPRHHALVSATRKSIITMASQIPETDLKSFREHLNQSTKILALLGAGLSASSGLPTFRGAGGLWRDHDAVALATPEAFEADPGIVWQFYGYRRHMALTAKPNAAHYALAELSRQRKGFITLSQNVDGMYCPEHHHQTLCCPHVEYHSNHTHVHHHFFTPSSRVRTDPSHPFFLSSTSLVRTRWRRNRT